MPLWGKADDGANTPLQVLNQLNKSTSNANRFEAYQNNTPNVHFTNMHTGVFGVSAQEQQAGNNKPAHSGWVLRQEGRGGRAGRVSYEVLVAGGDVTGGQDNVAFPDFRVVIHTQPQNNSVPTGESTLLTLVANTLPSYGNVIIQWQRTYPTVDWANVTNTTIYASQFGVTTPTLRISDVATVAGNTYRAVINVSNGGANVAFTQNAVITVT